MILDWEKLARSEVHPLRLQILELLMDGTPRSPLEMSKHFGLNLNTTGYHVVALRDAGLVTLVRTEPARGAVRHIYTVADTLTV